MVSLQGLCDWQASGNTHAVMLHCSCLVHQAQPQLLTAGGSCPSIQDSMAHADAALHLLKQVVEKESWYGHGVLATVQKKEAELQVSLPLNYHW